MALYAHPVTPITDVSAYFRTDPKTFSMTFVGKTLDVRIPAKFIQHGVLTIGDTVTTPGIMDMVFDETYQAGLNILASITIEPSDIGQVTIDGVDYVTLHLVTGDTFMTSYRVIQDPHIVYVLWDIFVTGGAKPYWINYAGMLRLFEHAKELTGSGIGVSRSVFESIIAHLSRDPDHISIQYRNTDRVKPMKFVALKSVSQATTGTIARMNGSYFRDEGMTSALLYKVDEPQPFENLLRGLSTAVDEPASDAIL